MSITKHNANELKFGNKNVLDTVNIDNKEILLATLIEKMCQIVDDKNVLFKKICSYLHEIGVISDEEIFTDDQSVIRKLYGDYLVKIMQKFCDDKNVIGNKNSLTEQRTADIQIINSRYAGNFCEIEKIGKGGFGAVYKAYNYVDEQLYAIKKVSFRKYDEINNLRALGEVRLLAKLNHRNIVRYNTSWIELDDRKRKSPEDNVLFPVLYIQMELCECSLYDYIAKRNYSGVHTNFSIEIKMIKSIVSGLKYIHEHNILHRDLTPKNIFLDSDMEPKIGDFGLSVKVETPEDNDAIIPGCGVKLYMPPEYKNNNIYTSASDIYSLGIIIFEMLYITTTEMERINVINNLKKNIFPSSFWKNAPAIINVIKSMISEKMNDRPSCAQLENILKSI